MQNQKGRKKRKQGDSCSCGNQRQIAVVFINHHNRARPIAPAASGNQPAQPFLRNEVAEEVVEATTSRTGFFVVTV
jgi:hypothetical protein